MSNGFYSGRRGPSLNIVKSYQSIDLMITDFEKQDCDVEFGACVIILAEKNTTDHGKLYRREYGLGKYQYLGNIAGPAGVGVQADYYYKVNIETLSGQSISQMKDEIVKIFGTSETEPIIVAYGDGESSTYYFGWLKRETKDVFEWQYLGTYSEYMTITTNQMDKEKNIFIPNNGIRLYVETKDFYDGIIY